MSRPARALLDRAALSGNLARVKSLAPRAKVMAVIKANAYGHGLAWAARALHDADAFGVASLEEGIELRAAGVRQPVCLLEGFFEARELPAIEHYDLSPVIHHEAQLWDLEHTESVKALDVWLKIDTGMHRLGFPPAAIADVLLRLKACPRVRRIAVLSHFANADNTFDKTSAHQLEQFLELVGRSGLERSMANSAGIVVFPESHLEWVRPGIMLYGASPVIGRAAEELGLKPVMTLMSALIAVQHLRKGDAVGYGGDFVCPEDMPVGIVAIGYGDGYPRQLKPGTPVLVNNARVPLVGRVSMDMITVDLREQPEARVGDPVVLWGRGLPVEEVAAHAGTIGYTLLCGVTPRIPRIDVDGEG